MSEQNYSVIEQNLLKKVLVKTDDVDVKIYRGNDFSWRLNHSCLMNGSMDENCLSFEIESNEAQYAEFELTVPDYLEEIRIETDSGDIEVLKVKADVLKLHSKRGDIKLEEAAAVLLIKTQSGDIDVECCDSDQMALNSTSGDIEVQGYEVQQMDIKTTSGEIEVDVSNTGMCLLTSVSGDIEFEGSADHLSAVSKSGDVEIGLFQPKELKVETVSGDVELSFKACTGFEGIAETATGNIELDLEDVLVSENALSWKDGSAKVIIKTVSGDVSLTEE